MKETEFDKLHELLTTVKTEVLKLRTAINGDDLGTPGLSHQLRAHTRDDDKNFAELRTASEAHSQEAIKTNLQIARWGGGIAVLIVIVGLAASLAVTYKISRADERPPSMVGK